MTVELSTTTKDSILELLLRQGENSASTLAEKIGISVQAMRRHLRNLEENGLVGSSSLSLGPGRPSNLWHLTTQGQNYFHNGSENFALELISSIQASLSEEEVISLLHNQVQNKASLYRKKIGIGAIQDRLEKLVSIRIKEGYISELNRTQDGTKWYLNEMSCSIAAIAEKHPFVCDQELQLLQQTFPDCEVKRVHWRIESGHTCGFFITPIDIK